MHHSEPGFEPLPHEASMDMMPHPHGAGIPFRHRHAHDTSFILGAVGNMMGGKGGGMMGGAMGGAAGAFGTYMLCKHAKGCTQKCAGQDEGCVKCLDMCAKLSAAGAAAGGAAGSAMGQRFAPGMKGGMPGGMYSVLDEWNTAPAFALLQKNGPPGVDRPVGKGRGRKCRASDFLDVDIETKEEKRVPGNACYVDDKEVMICFSNINGTDLGFTSDCSSGYSYTVESVMPGGFLQQWNELHSDRPDLQVAEGDRIVKVQPGISGSADNIISECRRRKEASTSSFLEAGQHLNAKGQDPDMSFGCPAGHSSASKGAGRGQTSCTEKSNGHGKGAALPETGGKGKGATQDMAMGKGKGAFIAAH